MPAKKSLLSHPEGSTTPRSQGGLGLPTVLLRLNKEGQLLWLSDGLFGKTVEQLLGLKLATVFKGASRDALEAALGPSSRERTQRIWVRHPITRQRISILMRPSSSTDEQVAFFGAVQVETHHERPASGQTPHIAKPKEDATPARRMVLVADDEPVLLTLTKRVLNMDGYSVLTAENGDECLKIFQENAESIGLVILDYSMPGPEISALLDEIAAGKKPPAILISTGYTNSIVRDGLETKHLWTHLQKPYSNAQLLQLASSLLDLPGD